MNSVVCNIFPTLIHAIEVENFSSHQDKLLSFVHEERRRDPAGEKKSNEGGWQSRNDLQNGENILKDYICTEVNRYLKSVLTDEVEVSIKALWINYNERGDFNTLHIHPGSHLAGVFWLKVPSMNVPKLWLDSPHFYTNHSEISFYTEEFKKKWNQYSDWFWNPTEGVMLLFPSSVYHKVDVSESDESRISCSFNLNFKEKW